jgi:hypothetical protein
MSTAIPCINCPSISNFPSIGFGPDFEGLKRYYDKIISEFRKAETLGRLDEVLQSLDELCKECSEEGWDGYDALPIDGDVCDEAKRLIRSLPINLPMPEINPEPDGGIGLEWSKGKRLVFAVSVKRKNEIVYAGLFGMNKTHGTEYFGDSLPSTIVENLKRLYCKD